MKTWVKTTIGISITILILLVGSLIIFNYILHKPIPDYSGTLESSKIKDGINIYYDENRIPYIIASNDNDAAFGLGFCHARERLFQMDVFRRMAYGRISEILGNKTVPIDQMFRTLGLSHMTNEVLNKLSENQIEFIDAYTDGINYYIKNNKGNYSNEFSLLDYSPEKWKIEHTLVLSKLLAWELNISWWTDIFYAHLIQKLGEEKARQIIADYPENSPTIIPKSIDRFADINLDLIKVDREFRKLTGFVGTHIGSNNWTVSPEKSKSGKPIIANDPHLALQNPSKWFIAVIKGKDLNTAGFTIPGFPVPVIGNNENISWTMTNVMADEADLYNETIDSTGTKYLLDDEWKPLTIIEDTIIVKDSMNAVIKIKKTHRGPIISEIHPYRILFENDYQNAVLSMRWTAQDNHSEIKSLIDLNYASNWDDFKAALKGFNVPGQNFVYADKENNIGYICAAKLPIRKNNSQSIVYDGSKSENDWKGYVPYKQMPKLFNPDEEFIATANNKTVSDFSYHISNLWEPASRIERIRELLNSKDKFSDKDFMQIQNDLVSPYAEKMVPFILKAFENTSIKDENLNLALELLDKWKFKMDKKSQVPAIYSTFFIKLLENTFKDELGEELFKEYVFLANIPYRVIQDHLNKSQSNWFDDVNTEKYESKKDIIRKSLVDALDELEEKFGSDLKLWQWGRLHKVKLKHVFSGYSEYLDYLIDVGPFEVGGDVTTVFNTSYKLADPFETSIGPSMRYIYDFNEPDHFLYIIPTGQSGHFSSYYYSNMTSDWLNGKYRKVILDVDSIQNSNFDLIKLKSTFN